MIFIRYAKLLFQILIIKIIDLPSRLSDLIKPSFYFKKLRIKKCFFNKCGNSKKIFIFVIHQKNRLPFYVKNVLSVLKKFPVDVHIVVNGDVDNEVINYLNNNCNKLTIRENIGRDFGAYKDEVLSLEINQYDYLYLINDSVFYFNKNLINFFEKLINFEGDWICLHENFEFNYHAQSFLVGFGPQILESKFFINYWKKYIPFTSRLHSIQQGEAALTHVLMKKGFAPYVINNMLELRQHLESLTIRQFISIMDSLWHGYNSPNYLRSIELTKACLLQKYTSENTVFYLNPILGEHRIDSDTVALFVQALETSNPTYSSAKLFAMIFNRPFFKRDVFFRDVVSISEFNDTLIQLGIDQLEIDECIYELRAKGNSLSLNFWSKIKHGVGLL